MSDELISTLTQRLSAELNKPIGESFVKSVHAFFLRAGSLDQFVATAAVLGFPSRDDNALAKEVFAFFESHKAQFAPVSHEKSPSSEGAGAENFGKQNRPLLSFEDDVLAAEVRPSKPPKRIKFKKIKKEVAMSFKQDHPAFEAPAENKRPKIESTKQPTQPSLAELAAAEVSKIKSETGQEEPLFSVEDDFNLENDREWYMTDEFGQNTGEIYTELEEETYSSNTQKKHFSKPKKRQQGQGGGFNEVTGEYYDLDHDDSQNDLSRLPIASHFFIPPFLEDSKDFLVSQVSQTTNKSVFTKGIASDFNPIKNSNSELARAAKNGSNIVKERRSKKERAQQAKDRSSLAGTQLGNVLGVGDEESTKVTPTIQKDSPPSKAEIINQRRSLPAYNVRSELMKMIADNQVTVVIGETGSGKTTQLTQFLYEEGYGSSLAKAGQRQVIGCTQPRRVAAMSVAKRVSEEMFCTLGEEVGYSIRFEDKWSHDKTIIKYMTEGILLREFLNDSNLSAYSCIIMDEAHERSLNTDIILGLLRNLIKRRKDIKIIVTSATMNADRFSAFFGNAPQFTIPGRTFPVDVFYSSGAIDYVEGAVKQVVTLHLSTLNEQQESDGDILVFMTGQEDIESTCELIQEKLDELGNVPPLDILPVYSSMPSDLQRKIFNKTNKLKRKVVVATNIAETSLTVDGVKYVIDCGLIKMKIYNPRLGMDALQVVPISKANASQRSGRAGRTGPGVAYRLYSEKELEEEMSAMPVPEIQRTNLNNVMLLLKSLKVDDATQFPFLDPPPKDILSCSLYDLWTIGALDNLGELTDLGLRMTNFPMEPSLSKLILLSASKEFHCSEDVLTIVSMLSVPSVFHRPKERANEADAARQKFSIAESDHLTLMNVYNQWDMQLRKPNMNFSKLNAWSTRNFLNNKSLLRARDIRRQLYDIMRKKNIPLSKSRSDEDIKKCLCASFFNQAAKISKINLSSTNQAEYVHLRHNYMRMYLHPTSSLAGGSDMAPPYVVYHELILTSKEYMSCITSVNPLWLLEYGYIFYDVTDENRQKFLADIDVQLVDKKAFQKKLEDDARKLHDRSNRQNVQKQSSSNAKFKKFKRVRGI